MISDDALNAQIQSITNLYDVRITDMKKINEQRQGSISTLGVRLGQKWTGSAGGVYGGVLVEEERQAANRITDLESQKQNSISAAKQAAQAQNWQVYGVQVSAAEKAYSDQVKAVQEMNKTIMENNKKIQEDLMIPSVWLWIFDE